MPNNTQDALSKVILARELLIEKLPAVDGETKQNLTKKISELSDIHEDILFKEIAEYSTELTRLANLLAEATVIIKNGAFELNVNALRVLVTQIDPSIDLPANPMPEPEDTQDDEVDPVEDSSPAAAGTSEEADEITSPVTPSPTSPSPTSPSPTSPSPTGTEPNVASPSPSKRSTDLSLLHPVFRKKVVAVQKDLKDANVPMKIFEAYRSPERQRRIYGQGRTLPGPIVSFANAWQSMHQYGLAVDMVIDKPGVGMWETGTAEARKWWDQYHEIARKNGLEPLSFEKPHIQLQGYKYSTLLNGEYPDGGDESWAHNLAAVITRWSGSRKPPLPDSEERPGLPPNVGLPSTAAKLPRIGWHSKFGGQSWRVDERGVYLRSVANGAAPLRSPGAPITVQTIISLYGREIAKAANDYGIPPQIIVMTIAIETGAYRNHDFTGPLTFRWEQHVKIGATENPAHHGERGDYSAGPMQVLSDTARWVATQQQLPQYVGKLDATFKFFKNKPNPAPDDLDMYKPEVSIDIGAAVIKQRLPWTGLDPILVGAAYNAGSLRATNENLWHLHVHGAYLDQAAQWLGDACAVWPA